MICSELPSFDIWIDINYKVIKSEMTLTYKKPPKKHLVIASAFGNKRSEAFIQLCVTPLGRIAPKMYCIAPKVYEVG